MTPELLFRLAAEGDEGALKIVNEIGGINAIGIANINTCYNPEIITIGGSIALNNRELIIEPIKEIMPRYTVNRAPLVEVTPLGETSSSMGP